MFIIKVPATSANVCVGFDVLGIALDLYNIFTFDENKEFTYTGFDNNYADNDNNMVYSAYKYVFDKAKKDLIPVSIKYSGDVPISRGLGSSSTLIVAGCFAANHYLGDIFSKEELLTFATELEGHPDNVAPAIFGGLCASYKDDYNKYHTIKYDVCNELLFTVIIPPFKLSTKEARQVLPNSLCYSDIVNNLSRIVNIPYAFKTGDIKMLKDLFKDKIHEPYRGTLIKGYNEIKEFLKSYDAAFAISGSGSTMIVISKNTEFTNELLKFGYEIKHLNVSNGIITE